MLSLLHCSYRPQVCFFTCALAKLSPHRTYCSQYGSLSNFKSSLVRSSVLDLTEDATMNFSCCSILLFGNDTESMAILLVLKIFYAGQLIYLRPQKSSIINLPILSTSLFHYKLIWVLLLFDIDFWICITYGTYLTLLFTPQ